MKSNDRHNYEYDVNVNGNTAPAHVVRMVGTNKRVLELGAGPGSITKILKEVGNCRVTGLERDTKAIPKLKNYCERVYEADLNDSSWSTQLAGEADFDMIVAADVLEHVYDPLTVLKTMVYLAGDTGQIVVSLPHASHSSVITCLLSEDFEYRDWGLLDRTHIRFFGLKNIQSLFADAGLTIVDAQFVVVPPEESEFADKWNNLDSDVKDILSRQPYGNVYQVVLKAVSQAQAETAIDLLSIDVNESPSASVPMNLSDIPRILARKYLSHSTRQKILKILKK